MSACVTWAGRRGRDGHHRGDGLFNLSNRMASGLGWAAEPRVRGSGALTVSHGGLPRSRCAFGRCTTRIGGCGHADRPILRHPSCPDEQDCLLFSRPPSKRSSGVLARAPDVPLSERDHPRTLGWLGTTALAMGGSNQSLFLIGA